VVVEGTWPGSGGSGFAEGRRAAEGPLQGGLEVGQAEGLHEMGDRLETPGPAVGRLDARAHDGDVAGDRAKGLCSLDRRCVGRLEDDHLDVPQRAVVEDRLVPQPGDHPAEELPYLGVGLTDEDAGHFSIVGNQGGNVGCIWYASGMKAGRILVVDDDPDIRGLLRELLGRAGYDVFEAETGKAGLRQLYAESPDLVLLDVSMPELDGWQTLERIRDLSEVPVILLTARGGELEKVRGLKGGADDYVTKPFGRQELLARVEALIRRSPARPDEPTTYADGLLTIDFTQREVTVTGTKTDLTPLEFKLLAAFVRHPNQVLSHDQLLELVWGDSLEGSRARAKLYVGYLRQKLADAGAVSSPIETIRGFGYRYRLGAP
jgi:DNA-binding response OmpR family regulator